MLIAVHLYIAWGYALVVSFDMIFFIGCPPEFFFLGGGHPKIYCCSYGTSCCIASGSVMAHSMASNVEEDELLLSSDGWPYKLIHPVKSLMDPGSGNVKNMYQFS